MGIFCLFCARLKHNLQFVHIWRAKKVVFAKNITASPTAVGAANFGIKIEHIRLPIIFAFGLMMCNRYVMLSALWEVPAPSLRPTPERIIFCFSNVSPLARPWARKRTVF